MKSIKKRIVLLTCLVCFFSLLFSNLASYILSRKAILGESTGKMTEVSAKYAKSIDGWFQVQSEFVGGIVNSIQINDNYSTDYMLNFLGNKLKSNSNVIDVYMGFPDKRFIVGSGFIPPDGFDCTSRGWYKDASSSKNIVYEPPYLDESTKQLVITIAKPLIKDGTLIGVVGADISMKYFTDMIQNAKPMNNSYGFLLDNQNNIIVHPNKEYQPTTAETKNITKVMSGGLSSIASSGAGSHIVLLKDYDGLKKYFATSKIDTAKWTIGFAVPESEAVKPLNGLILNFIILTILALLIAIILAYLFGSTISKPIVSLTKLVDSTKNHDLTDQNSYYKITGSKDEIGAIGKSVMSLRDELREFARTLKQNANELSERSGNIFNTTGEAKHASCVGNYK